MQNTSSSSLKYALYGLLLVALVAAPLVGAYPVFVAKLLCFALFASAFNLLLGYTGLLSFGHAALVGGAGYVAGYMIRDDHAGAGADAVLLLPAGAVHRR